MWDGYLSNKFKSFCKDKKLSLEYVHTSGHAQKEDLKSFARAINPKTLIPIHTFEAEEYPVFFKNVLILKDGEEFSL